MTGPMMKAATYRGPGRVEVVDVARPAATDGNALVAIDYCGICGTDLHMMIDGWGTPGSVFGHEWSGRVVEPGPSDLAPGTRVVGRPAVECGHCDRCRDGRPSLCRNRSNAGSGPEQGAFAGFVSLDPRRLIPVPDGIEAMEAAFSEPLAVALHAVTLAQINEGDRALVFGAGPIGAAIVAILRTRGVEVDVVEPGARRADLATRIGAGVRTVEDLPVAGHPGDIVADAVDVVFETSGVRAAAEAGLTQLSATGVLMLVGTGLDFPKLDTNRIILNELTITGAYNYDADGFRSALELIASGTLPLDLLIEPEPVGLDGLLDAMQRLRAGELPGKVMVTP
jgi:threonine dehydrogenase-like Zn-dependent dehydrogenase